MTSYLGHRAIERLCAKQFAICDAYLHVWYPPDFNRTKRAKGYFTLSLQVRNNILSFRYKCENIFRLFAASAKRYFALLTCMFTWGRMDTIRTLIVRLGCWAWLIMRLQYASSPLLFLFLWMLNLCSAILDRCWRRISWMGKCRVAYIRWLHMETKVLERCAVEDIEVLV